MVRWASGRGSVEHQARHLAAGICGSGIIEVVAEMYLAGIILGDGRFNPTGCTSVFCGKAGAALRAGYRRANGQR